MATKSDFKNKGMANLKKIYVASQNQSLKESFLIPEPTISLLWITDENISKIKYPMTITINLGDNKESDLCAEPSLIWMQLPVKKNRDLEIKKLYYPFYASLTPEQKYQYLYWLKDITQETNLSYVFLYYYGLERHLLIGNYDLAIDEILKLLKYHDKGTFKSYATNSLIAASIFRKKHNLLDKAPFVLDEISNVSLYLKSLIGMGLKAKDIIALANTVKFYNKRYLIKYPDLFREKLQDVIDNDEDINGNIFNQIHIENVKKEEEIYFANVSVPKEARQIKTPQILNDKIFQNLIYKLLLKTHEEIKAIKSRSNKK